MKKLVLLIAALLPLGARAQSPTGHIQYEVTQKVDHSQARIIINGQVVKPGSPDFPTDLPDVRTFGMTLAFAGNYAREERESGMMRVVMESGPGGGAAGMPQATRVTPPFTEAVYVNLGERSYATTLTVKQENKTTTYRAEQPFKKPEGWKEMSQTKKIAGYTCRKATAPYKGETYTIWYTTDLPFTYSPVKDLMPEKGVVLAVEGQKEQYKASKVDSRPVAEADVRSAADAQQVTPEELKDKREKALADFRQKAFEGETERVRQN